MGTAAKPIQAVRYAALDALRAAIEAHVPDLEGRITVPTLLTRGTVDPTPNHLQRMPALAVTSGPTTYDPQQAAQWRAVPPDIAVMDVGALHDHLALRLTYSTREERAMLEAGILDAFLCTESPGTLTLTVDAVELVGRFYATFLVDDLAWTDEDAWIPADKRHTSILAVTGDIPAFGIRRNAWAVGPGQLKLAISTVIDGGLTAPGIEVFTVNADGSLTGPEA